MGILQKTRMFNAGERIVDTFIYTLEDGHDPHCVARWVMDAPANDFFDIPDTLSIRDMRISVHFVDTALMRFADRGIIAIDANYDQPADPEEDKRQPIANTDAAAAVKGKERWKDYYMAAARAHIEQCQNCRAANMPPVPASGFTKRALVLAGLIDPADAFIQAAQTKSDDITELKKQLDRQQQLIEQLLADKTSQEWPAGSPEPRKRRGPVKASAA